MKLPQCPQIDIFVGGINIRALACITDEIYAQHVHKWKHFSTLPLAGQHAVGLTGEKSLLLESQFLAKVSIRKHETEVNFILIPKLVRECIIDVDYLHEWKTIVDIPEQRLRLKIEEDEDFLGIPSTLDTHRAKMRI